LSRDLTEGLTFFPFYRYFLKKHFLNWRGNFLQKREETAIMREE
jgi:hypothetical protein